MISKIKKIIAQLKDVFAIKSSDDFLLLALKMILITLCLSVNGFLSCFLIIGLLITKVTLNKFYWIAITVIFFIYYVLFNLRDVIPNHAHVFVLMLILGAITVIFYNENKDWKSFLGTSSKWIIGFIFLFATIGKLLSPDFLDGSFFEFMFFSDYRFQGFTSVLLSDQLHILTENKQLINSAYYIQNPENTELFLKSNSTIQKIALLISYWTIFIEGIIALLFLLPSKFKITKCKDFFLLLFILSTYPIATVVGFAMSLLMFAFVCSYLKNGTSNIYTYIYLILFLVAPIFYFPFTRILNFLY